MIQLGVSLYPEQETLQQIEDYLKLAKSYGFSKVFTSLFSVEGTREQIISYFRNLSDIAFIGMIFLFWPFSFEIKFLHQSLYFLVIDDKAAIDQLMTYSSDTVPAFVLFEDTSDRIDDLLVLDLFIVISRSGQPRYFEQIS